MTTTILTGSLVDLGEEALPNILLRFKRDAFVGQDGQLVSPSWVSVRTDEDGEFSIVLLAGNYSGEARLPGYKAEFELGIEEDLETLNLSDALQANAVYITPNVVQDAAAEADRAEEEADRATNAANAVDSTGRWVESADSFFSDTIFGYSSGVIVSAGQFIQSREERFSWEVALAGATDQVATIPGGVKVYATPKVRKLNIEQLGGAPDDATLNGALANKALAYFGATGGELAFEGSGNYLIENTKANPYKAGRRIGIDIQHSNTTIRIGRSATLKLADGQQTDAGGAVEVIGFGGTRSNLLFMGGGRIIGNTAGQTGWTGGYLQATAGSLITGNDGTFTDIMVRDLTLEDAFSSPVFIACDTANRGKRIHYRNLLCRNTGEGAWLGYCDGMSMRGIRQVLDSGITMAGDGIESENCTDFLISDFSFIVNSGVAAGTSIELYGSQNGLVTGFNVKGANGGLGLGQAVGKVTDDILICNGVMKGLLNAQCVYFTSDGRVVLSNIDFIDCAGGFVSAEDDTHPPIELYNVRFDGCKQSLLTGSRKLIWHGGCNKNSQNYGLTCNANAAGQTRNLDVRDVEFSGGASGDARFNDAAHGTFSILGHLEGIRLSAPPAPSVSSGANVAGLSFTSKGETSKADVSSTTVALAGFYDVIYRASTNIYTLAAPTQAKRVMIVATGNFTATDQSQANGVDIFLDGGVNFVMAAGDSLTLQYRSASEAATAGWYEVARMDIS